MKTYRLKRANRQKQRELLLNMNLLRFNLKYLHTFNSHSVEFNRAH